MTPDESEMLATVGRALWSAALMASAPDGERLRERMRHPQPGDLVMEISSMVRRFDPDGIGRLVRVEGEYPDDRFVVEPLHAPGTEQGWQNAKFIALPTDRVFRWAEDGAHPDSTTRTESSNGV